MSEDEILLTHILQCRPVDLLLKKPQLTPQQGRRFEECKARRLSGEPLQYIIGSWEFYGLEFKVDSRALVPRPETEILVDLAIKKFQGSRILELGTGSGNIAVALAKFLPYVQVTTADISLEALALAMENAQRHEVESRIEFVHADMKDVTGSFDLVISNPPYIPSSELKNLPADVQQEPAIALDGGEDGLKFYRAIINRSPSLLSPGGYLMMEFGDGQAEAISSLAQKHFKNIEIYKDLTGRERVICGKICH